MACIIHEDHSEEVNEFVATFVSEQDEINYEKLYQEREANRSEALSINIKRELITGEPVLSYQEYRTHLLLNEIDVSLLPEKLCVLDVNNIHDFSHYTGMLFYIVSEKFKDIIESIEPNVHFFTPVELVDKAGAWVAQHYIFRCMAMVDAIDPDFGMLDIGYPFDDHDKNDYYYYYGAYRDQQAMIKDKIQGRACFYELHWQTAAIFVTDEVKQLMQKNNLKPLIYENDFQEI